MCGMFLRYSSCLGSSAAANAVADTQVANPSLLLLHLPLWAVIAGAASLFQFALLFCAVIFLVKRLRGRGRVVRGGDDRLAAKKEQEPSVVGRRSVAGSKDEKLLLTAMDVIYLQLRRDMAEEARRTGGQEQDWPEHRLGTGAEINDDESTLAETPAAAAAAASATGLCNSFYENFTVEADVHV